VARHCNSETPTPSSKTLRRSGSRQYSGTFGSMRRAGEGLT